MSVADPLSLNPAGSHVSTDAPLKQNEKIFESNTVPGSAGAVPSAELDWFQRTDQSREEDVCGAGERAAWR